jgi:hypothetical protein
MVGSVQAFTVELIPPTSEGRELLLSWIVSDSKKVDTKTLKQMWQKWDEMRRQFEGTRGGKADGREDPLVARASESLAVAESWLLSPEKVIFSTVPEYRDAFSRNLWRQVFNPDARVRRKALSNVFSTIHVKETLSYIKKQSASVLVRQKALEDAKALCSESLEAAKSEQEVERVRARYSKIRQALSGNAPVEAD